MSSARNYGISHSYTPYVMFVDCDDYVEKTFVEKMLSKICEVDADVVCCGVIEESVAGECLREYGHDKDEVINIKDNPDVISTIDVIAWNKIYSSALFTTVRFPEGYVYEDSMTIPRLVARSTTIAYISEKLYHYVMWPNSLSRSQNKHLRDRKEIPRIYLKDPYKDKYKEQYEYLIVSYLYSYIETIFLTKQYRVAVKKAKTLLSEYGNPCISRNACYQRMKGMYTFWGKCLFTIVENQMWMALKIFLYVKNTKNKLFKILRKYIKKRK